MCGALDVEHMFLGVCSVTSKAIVHARSFKFVMAGGKKSKIEKDSADFELH